MTMIRLKPGDTAVIEGKTYEAQVAVSICLYCDFGTKGGCTAPDNLNCAQLIFKEVDSPPTPDFDSAQSPEGGVREEAENYCDMYDDYHRDSDIGIGFILFFIPVGLVMIIGYPFYKLMKLFKSIKK